ncbi:MAG: hypothetical protein NTZ33_15090 [Bacteroidetes bacterium]|nr:hypothetical protein [Bacteroidota bacterium]
MKTRFLFPNVFKTIGWILLVAGIILWIYGLFFNDQIPFLNIKVFAIIDSTIFQPVKILSFIDHNITVDLMGILIITGAIFIAFSKEKYEDEYIGRIRLESLLWATYINYAILVFCILFIYGTSFFNVLIYNMVSLLIFFLIRFNLMLYKTKRQLKNEK